MIGRFISADSLYPNVYDPQTLDRYTYCLNNPIKYIDPDGHETVIDKNGNVVFDPKDEEDENIYQFDKDGMGPPAPIGKTYHGKAFKKGNKIRLGHDLTEKTYKLALNAEEADVITIALDSFPNKPLDVKSQWKEYKPTDGVLLDGKYASIRDIGNALAGLNSKNKGVSHEPFQRMAGALHQKKGIMGVIKARLGSEYGPAPEYGEESCQYKMSKIGYTSLHKSYIKWKQTNNHFNYSRFKKISNIHY